MTGIAGWDRGGRSGQPQVTGNKGTILLTRAGATCKTRNENSPLASRGISVADFLESKLLYGILARAKCVTILSIRLKNSTFFKSTLHRKVEGSG